MEDEDTRLRKQQNVCPSMSTLRCLLYYEFFFWGGRWGHNIFSHPLDF